MSFVEFMCAVEGGGSDEPGANAPTRDEHEALKAKVEAHRQLRLAARDGERVG